MSAVLLCMAKKSIEGFVFDPGDALRATVRQYGHL